MRTITKRLLPVAAVAAAALPCAAFGGPAYAAPASDSGSTTLMANLTQVNDSGAHSTAWGTLQGNQLTLKIKSSGLLAGMPHAQHIHVGGTHSCPGADMKGKGVNGHLRTTDAAGSYGTVKVSLTTKGDTGADSALAVKRFPVGDAMYQRTITLPPDIAADVRAGHGVMVQHGVDYNGNGKYDGDAKSDLDPNLPEEATDPATCGVLKVSQMDGMPQGGAETGSGSTAGVEDRGVLTGGAAAVVLGGGGLFMMRRRAARARR